MHSFMVNSFDSCNDSVGSDAMEASWTLLFSLFNSPELSCERTSCTTLSCLCIGKIIFVLCFGFDINKTPINDRTVHQATQTLIELGTLGKNFFRKISISMLDIVWVN